MSQETVKLTVPFESLAASVRELGLADKFRLWELLEQELAQAEEEQWEQDPAMRSEIREARAAYQAGDYISLEEYMARQRERA